LLKPVAATFAAMNRLRARIPPPGVRTALTVFVMLVGGILDGATVGLLMPLLATLTGAESSSNALEFLFPWLLKLDSSRRIVILASALFLLVALKNVTTHGSLVMASRLRANALIELRRQLLDRLLHAPPATLEKHTTGEIVATLLAEATRVNRCIEYTITLAQRLIMVFGYLIAVVILSWKLTLATIALGVVLGACSALIGKRALKLGRDLAGAGLELGRQVSETVGGWRVVRTTASEAKQAKAFQSWNAAQANAEADVALSQALIVGTTETLGMAGAMGLTAMAHTIWLSSGTMDASRFLAFAFGMMRLLAALNQVYSLQTAVTALTGSIERTLTWLDTPHYPERPFGTRELRDITQGVTFDRVSFQYPGGSGGVKAVSFHLPAGQTLAVLGASGSGKSTLVSLILRLREPSEGKILIDGVDHWEFSAGDFHRTVAFVEQDPFLFNGTIAENVAFGAPWVTREDVLAAIARVHLSDFLAGLPRGVDTIVGERGATVSGGQRQRLAIARAIVRDPKLLILDEPTSALDAATEREVVLAIEAARVGRTTIVISHRPGTVERADRTLTMRDGVVVGDQDVKNGVLVGQA